MALPSGPVAPPNTAYQYPSFPHSMQQLAGQPIATSMRLLPSWPIQGLQLPQSIYPPLSYVQPRSLALSYTTSLPYRPALISPAADLTAMQIATSSASFSHVMPPAATLPSAFFYSQQAVPTTEHTVYPPFIPFTSGDYDIPGIRSPSLLTSIAGYISSAGHVDPYAALAAMLHEATTSPPTSSSSTVSVRPSSSTTPPSSIDDRVSRQIAKSSFHNHGGVSKPLGRRNWTAEDYKKLIDAHNSGSDALETAKAIGIPRSTASRFAENSI